MLVYVLDNLHEDLSRVKEKPYIEIKEKDVNESEEDASKRWWDSHLKRENSIIVDLFYGQFKSEIKCLKCGKISITFDPFVFLGLPIPNINFSIKIKLFWENPFKSMTFIEFIFNEQTTVHDLKEFVYNKLKEKVNLVVFLTKELNFIQILKDSEVLSPILETNDFEVILWQSDYSQEENDNKSFICSPTKIFEETKFLLLKSEIRRQFMYPKPFVLHKDLRIIDLHLQIFKFYRKLFPDLKDNRNLRQFQEKLEKNDEEYLEEEFSLYRKSNFMKLYIMNNLSQSNAILSKQICDFCGKENCDFCEFNFQDGFLIGDAYKPLKNRKYFILLTLFNSSTQSLSDDTFAKQSIMKNTNISISDCLGAFREGERLERDNAWYCGYCKKHQPSLKKIDAYRLPKILIIQLKRFKTKNSNLGIVQNQKNSTMIDYPLTGLHFPNIDEEKGNIYDLFAVSSHIGSISSGHYVAMCNNRGNWYMYDDSNVYKLSHNQVVSESAYLLFYRKR
jgi:ubiquitin carboxyl-terminal hydrolase 4/11/15